MSPQQLAEAQAITEIVCIQNFYNLAQRGDDGFIDALAAQGIAYVPYFPLGGFSPLQSSKLDAIAAIAGGDADAGGAGVAAAAVAECAADSGDVVAWGICGRTWRRQIWSSGRR